LTAHLSSAITIYMLLFWFGLGLIDKRRIATTSDQTAKRLWRFRLAPDVVPFLDVDEGRWLMELQHLPD